MMLHAEPQSNIKDRIRLHYYLRDHLGNTVVAFDDRNYDSCPPVWRGAKSDVEEGTQSEVIGRYHYYSRRDLGSSVEEPLARPSPALERDAFGERGCASHTKWLVAEVKRSVCPADRHGRSRSDSGVITLHARRHEVLMRKQWNHAWVGSDIGGYWQQRYRYNGKELHSNSGLLDYGFRYYDPSVGRFTGVDPIAEDFAHVSVYNYSENEPIAHVDLWGLQKADAVHWTSVEKRMVRKGGGNPALVDAYMDGAGKVGQVVLNNTGAGDAITIFVGASEGNLNDVAQGTFDLFGGRVTSPLKAAGKAFGLADDLKDAKKAYKGARTEPKDLQEKLTLDEAKGGAGRPFMEGKTNDPKYDTKSGTHDKMKHNRDHGDGTSTEVHYD